MLLKPKKNPQLQVCDSVMRAAGDFIVNMHFNVIYRIFANNPMDLTFYIAEQNESGIVNVDTAPASKRISINI